MEHSLKLISNLKERNVDVTYHQEVQNIERLNNGYWKVTVKDLNSNTIHTFESEFVFIGAGEQVFHFYKTGIKQSKHVGGFPVSGLFLRCKTRSVIERHYAKVYGKADVGAPPMSVPHLDTICKWRTLSIIWTVCRFLT